MRPTHWAKNGFVLAPLLFAKEFSAHAIFSVIAATIAFCFISSAVYVLNDWFDRRDDAEHPTKCRRPLASGELSGRDALLIGGHRADGLRGGADGEVGQRQQRRAGDGDEGDTDADHSADRPHADPGHAFAVSHGRLPRNGLGVG